MSGSKRLAYEWPTTPSALAIPGDVTSAATFPRDQRGALHQNHRRHKKRAVITLSMITRGFGEDSHVTGWPKAAGQICQTMVVRAEFVASPPIAIAPAPDVTIAPVRRASARTA
jgi:hypothetical protein